MSDAVIHGMVRPIADNFLSPFLKRAAEYGINNLDKKKFLNGIEDYLSANYTKLRSLSSLVFPGEGIDLYEIYEPLTLMRHTSTSRPHNVVIREFPSRLLFSKKIIISDAAGMGKSTLLRYLFLKAIENGIGVPVFLELRRLRSSKGLLQLIKQDLGGYFSDISDRSMVSILENGNFIIFLDGFDEIQTEDDDIIISLREQIDSLRGCKFIMSSRPERTEGMFPDFRVYNIKSLKKEQAFSIITKISKNNAIGIKLIGELRSLRNIDSSIEDFLTNPLLTSLLYKAYEHKPAIPEQKHLFFDSVFDALYEAHDYRKDGVFRRKKTSGLNSTKFRRIMSLLGHLTSYHGKVEYSRTELLKHIKDVKNFASDLDFDEDCFLDDICNAVPVFTKDGLIFKWSHKSMQDYFVALYISNFSSDPAKVIGKILEAQKFIKYVPAFDMVKEMKPGFIEKCFIIPFLREYLETAKGDIIEDAFYKRRMYSIRIEDLPTDLLRKELDKYSNLGMTHLLLQNSGLFIESPFYVLLENSYCAEGDGLMIKSINLKHRDESLNAFIELDSRNLESYASLDDDSHNGMLVEILGIEYCNNFIRKYDGNVIDKGLPDIF